MLFKLRVSNLSKASRVIRWVNPPRDLPPGSSIEIDLLNEPAMLSKRGFRETLVAELMSKNLSITVITDWQVETRPETPLTGRTLPTTPVQTLVPPQEPPQVPPTPRIPDMDRVVTPPRQVMTPVSMAEAVSSMPVVRLPGDKEEDVPKLPDRRPMFPEENRPPATFRPGAQTTVVPKDRTLFKANMPVEITRSLRVPQSEYQSPGEQPLRGPRVPSEDKLGVPRGLGDMTGTPPPAPPPAAPPGPPPPAPPAPPAPSPVPKARARSKR